MHQCEPPFCSSCHLKIRICPSDGRTRRDEFRIGKPGRPARERFRTSFTHVTAIFAFRDCRPGAPPAGRARDNQLPIAVSAPTGACSSRSSSATASGRMCSSRFVGGRSRIMARVNRVRSCSIAIFRSTVTNTSNTFSASASRSPFLMPAQPFRGTVVTVCPTKSRASLLSTHSSSKIFT